MKTLKDTIVNMVRAQADVSKKQAESSEEVKGMKNATQAGMKKAESEAENKTK